MRVGQAGICGTDLKIVAGAVPVATPRVLGHEMTGVVEVPGPSGRVPAGADVLVNPGMFCGRCDLCGRGLPNICRNGGLLGRDADGTFAELVAVDEKLLHPIPPGLGRDASALLQVLATCVRAQALLDAHPRVRAASAVVVGLGVTGLLHVQLLRARGVPVIVGVTRSPAKRDLAARLGATAVVHPDHAARIVAEATNGRGADVAIECAGTPATAVMTIDLAGAGGTILQFGTIAPVADGMPTYQWYFKELTILNPRAQRPEDCDAAIGLAVRGQLDLASLVTSRFPLDQAAAAVRACADPAQLKVVLDVT